MKYKQEELANGAKLAYVKNKISKTTKINIRFDCGSRCDKIPGLAHFTEHMFFTGTKDMTKEEVSKKYFDFMDTNAYTSQKEVYFAGNVFTREFKDYLATVAKLITQSTFSKSNVDKERKVIKQEIATCNDNYRTNAYYFNNHNLTKNGGEIDCVVGTSESVSNIKSNDIKNFVKEYFVANNMFVQVSSPLGLRKVKKLVESELATKLDTNLKLNSMPYFCFNTINDSFIKTHKENIKKTYVFINFTFDKTVYDFKFVKQFNLVLDMINDISEGIMKQIRLKKSLVYGGGFYSQYNDKNSRIIFETECDQQNIPELLKEVASYIKHIMSTGFTEQQLKKAQRAYDFTDDDAEPRVKTHFNRLTEFKYYGKVLKHKWLRKIRKQTTLEDCNNLFKEVFSQNRVSLSVYGDFDKSNIIKKADFEKMFTFKS